MASQISGHLTPLNGFVSIATQTVGAGGASSITFTGIPASWKHLQLRVTARCSATGGANNDINFTFNNDNGNNYSRHRLYGANGTAGTSGVASSSFAGTEIGVIPSTDMTANVFGIGIIDILDYTNTNKYKPVKILSGVNDNTGTGTTRLAISSSSWNSTSAINSITVFTSSYNYLQYSTFALYGIQGV
jgi:hypothetical protein